MNKINLNKDKKKMKFSELNEASGHEDEVAKRLKFVKRDCDELTKDGDDEASLYLNAVNLVCNGIKLLGAIDPVMLRDEHEINTDKYKKIINELVKQHLR